VTVLAAGSDWAEAAEAVGVAAHLLNGSRLVGRRLAASSHHDPRDLIHFTRQQPCDDLVDDVRRGAAADSAPRAALNVTVHRVHDDSAAGAASRASGAVEVRLRGAHATLAVRCGAPAAAAERGRLGRRARDRAVAAAWRAERERVRAGALRARAWTPAEADELARTGRVAAYTGVYLRDDGRLPDSPSNVRFVPATT